MKTTHILMLALSSVLILAGCGSSDEESAENENLMNQQKTQQVVVMETTKGTMKIMLYDQTPQHRDNFLKLVDSKFYDGLRFHRVISGFMIQGGDPFSRDTSKINQWGTGGPGYTVSAEIIDSLRHKKGALAAARLGDQANPRRASSGSQFYIVQDDMGCRHLDGQYTVFGEVTEGLDVIDNIALVRTDPYDRPLEDVMILKVYREVPPVVEKADSTDSTAAPVQKDTI